MTQFVRVDLKNIGYVFSRLHKKQLYCYEITLCLPATVERLEPESFTFSSKIQPEPQVRLNHVIFS